MNWNRKQANLEKEKRIVKPKKAVTVTINSVDPRKEFTMLPIVLDWHIDSIPCMIIMSPHERFIEVLEAYYDGIRRNIQGYAWHVDNIKILDEMQITNRSETPCHALHCFAFDPDRVTMSALMQRMPFFHRVAEHRFKETLAMFERSRVVERAYDSRRGSTRFWTTHGTSYSDWTVNYNTGNVIINI